jgi:protein gp37
MRFANTWKVPGLPWTPDNAAQNVRMRPERLEQPLRWGLSRMVFVNSMSDLFHEAIPDAYIAKVFAVMAAADRHVFQVLTKRPERMATLLAEETWQSEVETAIAALESPANVVKWPLPNVWLGTSIENRRFAFRADLLRETPAEIRFVSAEPLLGPLATALDLTSIDWLIVGGESGSRHRTMDGEWVRDLRRSAHKAQTAFFFKQWGGRTSKANGRELDGRTWNELPKSHPRSGTERALRLTA